MFIQDIPSGQLLYIMLYGGAAMAALIAFVYLLLRRGNAFAPDVTPPLAMHRWAAAFFAVACLGHFWWLLLYFRSNDINSVGGMVVSPCSKTASDLSGPSSWRFYHTRCSWR